MPLPSLNPPQRHADWLTDMRFLLARQEREFYWIIDACAHPDLPGVFWELDEDPQALPLYMNTWQEEASESGPWMLPVRGHEAVGEWCFAQSGERPLGCLAEIAPGTYDEVFDHLQWQLECRPDGGRPALFRWYDPRILYGMTTWPGLPSILSRFMGPTLRLHAWEPGRCVPIVCGSGEDTGYRSEDEEAYPDALFDHIWDETMIHSIIGTLGLSTGEALRAMPLPEAYAQGERVALALSAAGYDDRRSLAYAMSLSARFGPGIWDDPRVNAALAERPANAPLMDVIDELNLYARLS